MSEPKTIPAKYVFLNIVGFTHNRSVEAQAEIIQALNSIVESVVREFGLTKEDVLFLPSGDGLCVALLNIESPYDIHLLIALNVIREISRYNARTADKMRRFEAHVGLNAYTDNFITDINGNRNIAGTGVSTAARVMSRADGNQVLVSQAVFDALQYHEKYLSSFRSFKTKLENGDDFTVHQFIAPGHEGLNVAVPQSLKTAVRTEPQQQQQQQQPVQPTTAGTTNSFIGRVEFSDSSSTAKTAPSIPEISLPDTQRVQTQSYLTGILAEEKTKTEAKPVGWIKPNAEPKPFLEEIAPQKNNRAFLWALVVVLVLGGAGFGAWMFSGDAPIQSVNQAAESAAEKPAASVAPENIPATAALPTAEQNQTIAETTTKKQDQAFTPKQTEEPETKPAAKTAPKPRQAVSRPVEKRRTVQPRTVKASTPVQPKPKPQTAKAEKPKPAKTITLDDLINGNR